MLSHFEILKIIAVRSEHLLADIPLYQKQQNVDFYLPQVEDPQAP